MDQIIKEKIKGVKLSWFFCYQSKYSQLKLYKAQISLGEWHSSPLSIQRQTRDGKWKTDMALTLICYTTLGKITWPPLALLPPPVTWDEGNTINLAQRIVIRDSSGNALKVLLNMLTKQYQLRKITTSPKSHHWELKGSPGSTLQDHPFGIFRVCINSI